MPQIRAEQVLSLTLKDVQIADDAAIKQHKIESWETDASGWISQGIIKPVTTAELPVWDGSQAGQFYYDINTNEIFIGISTAPYYQLIAGEGSDGHGTVSDRILVVKDSFGAENWTGVDENDLNGTASIFALDTDKVASDGTNLMVYLNGVLQERGSGNDYILYEEGGVDKIQFTYNLEGPDNKITAVVSIDEYLVNYATKAYVENILMDTTAHDHNGSGSPQLDFNEAITASSLTGIIHSIIPETNAVNLGSATNPFGNIYADEGHFAANTIFLGNVALSGAGDTILVSKDAGVTYNELAVTGSETEPTTLVAGAGQPVVLESTVGITAKGDILPDMTGAIGIISNYSIGSPTTRFNSIYADEVFVGASSLYVNGKKVIQDVSDEMTFQTSTDQAMKIATDASTPGSGNANVTIQAGNEFNVIAAGGMEWTVGAEVSTKHMNFLNSSAGGNLTFTTAGANSQIQFNAADEIDLTAPVIDLNGSLSLSSPVTFQLSGDVSGSATFDGHTTVSIAATVANDSHTHDGRYYTESESDARFVNVAGDTMTGDLILNGNLTVTGTTTTINTETLSTADNMVLLNSNVTGTPTENAGLEIERGTSTNYHFLFQEADDTFRVGEVGSTQAVATRQDSPATGGIPFWNTTATRFDTTAAVDVATVSNIPTDTVGTVTTGYQVNAHEFHTQGVGAGQIYIAGSNIDSNVLIRIGMGLAGGQTVQNAEFGGTVTSTRFIGPLTGNVTGNASTATKLATARTIDITGDITATAVAFDGSQNIAISAAVNNNSHTHVSSNISDATNANTANMIVRRDASGGFSAGSITLSGDLNLNTIGQRINLGNTAGAVAYIESLNGQVEIGSDNQIIFQESDADVSAVVISVNDKTVTASGGFIGPLIGNVTGTASTATWADTVNVNTSTSSSTYGVVWHSDDTLYANADVKIQPSTGYFWANRVYNAVYNDLAEFFPKAEDAEPGMVMIQTADGVKPCEGRGNGAVVGVYSDSYGYALGGDEDAEGKIPVGLSGRVWVWVEEPCNIGDLLITSDKKGFGTVKRAGEDGLGKVFAKVMKPKTDDKPERVEVLILNG